MKSQILLVLFILMSTHLYSQESYDVYRVASTRIKNGDNCRIKSKKTQLKITIYEKLITISDVANSKYVLSNPTPIPDYESKIMCYNGIDEENRKCNIILEDDYRNNESYLVVMYQNYMFKYFYKKKEETL